MITIKKNPETVGKLKVGTSSATPADGDIVADKVGVGTAPIDDSKLDIAGAGTQRLYVRETGSTVRTKMLTTTSKGAVGTETNHPLELQTNDQTRLTIANTGLATFAGGIAFQSATTGSGTGVGYTLDSYEYGTWTPTLPNGGTLTTNMKTYTRIGNLCTVHFYVSSIAPSATSSRFEIGGLPFTISNDANYYPAGTIGYCGDGDMHDAGLVGERDGNKIYFHTLDGASGALSNNQIISRFSGSNDDLICTLTYKVK